jgi:hypothetical protein
MVRAAASRTVVPKEKAVMARAPAAKGMAKELKAVVVRAAVGEAAAVMEVVTRVVIEATLGGSVTEVEVAKRLGVTVAVAVEETVEVMRAVGMAKAATRKVEETDSNRQPGHC